MHWLLPYAISLLVGGVFLFILQLRSAQRLHRDIIAREGCQPPKCLPNKWFPPFGLDKLGKVIESEKARAYPLLMLSDHEKYGDTYTQYGGPVYTIITRDPRNLRVVLSRQFKNFEVGAGRHGCINPLLGDGIFTQDGSKWELSRKLLAPLIQRPTLPDLNLIEGHFQKLYVRILSDTQSPGSHVNLKEPLFDLSLDLTTEFLLGGSMASSAHNSDSKECSWTEDFAKEFNTAFKWIAKRERLKGFYWMIDSKEFRKSCKAAQEIIDKVISQSIQSLQSNEKDLETYIALEPLLREQKDVRLIRDQFLNLLLAGRDTSGSLLCWVFYSLAREPDLARALKSEIMASLGTERDRMPTKRELGQMTLLDKFITETLRLFPPVPINGRFSTEATYLPHGGGVDGESPMLVPKGSLIAFSTFATHHSPKLYGDDAGQFRVQRWKDDIIKERRMIDWSYHPFIGGPRKCLGERFALIQAKYLTCRILQHFDQIVASDENGATLTPKGDGRWVEDVKYHVGLTMSPDDGVWIRATPLGC